MSRRSGNRRRLINGIRWRVRTGVPWRDLPREYGPGRPFFTGSSDAGSARASVPGS
ncbi:transposase [Streptomyces sp. NPDC012794]|uniref:transposase n=1 Tax=Streptomyces sp. NPDC012794 TaxID=3364850 RepID=UPI0036929076